MREIKFRGWSEFYEKWVYGYYYVDSEFDYHFIDNGSEDFRVDQKSVGQYTGLKDSKGVEIYEGDKVKVGIHYAGDNHEPSFTGKCLYEDNAFHIESTDALLVYNFDYDAELEVIETFTKTLKTLNC